MTTPHPIDTLLLDVGGVLLLPDHRAVLEAVASVGARAISRDLDAAHYRALAAAESDGGPPPDTAPSRYWTAYARAAGVPEEQIEAAARAIAERQGRKPLFTRTVPGSRGGLRAIAATGVRVVLVSNTRHGNVEDLLRHLGICQVGAGHGVPVHGIVDSHVVGVAKPDPAIFELALTRAGGTPSHTVHVGDSLRTDVEGALASGVHPLHLDPLRICPHADHAHAATLAGVAARLRSLRERG